MLTLRVYTDGGARGNPGESAIAGMIYADDVRKAWFAEKIGFATNNQAEYRALLKALQMARQFAPANVTCHSDSEIIIKQMRDEYKCKNPDLAKLKFAVMSLEADFESVQYVHLPRENSHINACDFMLNEVLDGRQLVKT